METKRRNKVVIILSIFFLFLFADCKGDGVEEDKEEKEKKEGKSNYEQLQGNWVFQPSPNFYITVSNDTWIKKDFYARKVVNKVHKFILLDKSELEKEDFASEIAKTGEMNHNGIFVYFVDELIRKEQDKEEVLYMHEYGIGGFGNSSSSGVGFMEVSSGVGKTVRFNRVEEIDEEAIKKSLAEEARKENIKGEEAYRRKDYRKAQGHFIGARIADDENARAYLNKSITTIKQGYPKSAIEEAEKGIEYSESDRERGVGYYNIGLAYESMGKSREALKNYKKSYSLRKNKRVLEKIKELEGRK